MINKRKIKNITWIDVIDPTKDDLQVLFQSVSIDDSVANDLLTPSYKPILVANKDYIYLVLHFPASKHSHSNPNQEIDFIITKKQIITIRYDVIDTIHKFAKIFEVGSILNNGDFGDHAGFLMYYILRKLYKSVNHELEFISDKIKDTENKMFNGDEKAMVIEISILSRTLLDFKQSLIPHHEITQSLINVGASFFGKEFSPYLNIIHDDYIRLTNALENNKAVIMELRETNNSLVTTKQNEVMKILTIMAFVTFPLSLIASIFGMNTTHLPVVGRLYDFEIIIGFMLLATLLFFVFFKYKKWL